MDGSNVAAPRISNAGDLGDVPEELEAVVGELYLCGFPRHGAVSLNDEDGLSFKSETARGHEDELVVREISALFAYRAKLAKKIPEYAACFLEGTSNPIHRAFSPRGHRCRT